MPLITPKDTIQKTYRLETRQADDLEKLSKAVGRTQNELVVAAVTELLFQNRKYFMQEVVETRLKKELEQNVQIHENEYEYILSSWELKMIKMEDDLDGESWFQYCYQAKNRKNKVIFVEEGKLNVKDKTAWSDFLEKVIVNLRLYADLEDEEMCTFFRNYFISRS